MSRVYPEYSRVTGILSFYDEPLELLAACVSSMTGVVDHLVAVDGAYMLFPDAKPASDPAQLRLIEEICRGARIGLTTHTPSQVWAGNEVQKRNFTLRLAEPVTDPEGWYLVLDADCVVTHVAFDWFEQLAQVPADLGVIEIGVREVRPLPEHVVRNDAYSPIRLMYRALRGMEYGPTHWTIRAPDPESGEDVYFWGDRRYNDVMAAFDGTHLLKIDHRFERPESRAVDARRYYARRDKLGIERGTQVLTQRADGSFRPVTRPAE